MGYCINIIDSPGFGDTRGIQMDEQIARMVGATIKTLDSLDYLLVVSQSTITRITPQVEWVLQNIQDLFSVDVKDRFMSMLTFCDGKPPNAINLSNKQAWSLSLSSNSTT